MHCSLVADCSVSVLALVGERGSSWQNRPMEPTMNWTVVVEAKTWVFPSAVLHCSAEAVGEEAEHSHYRDPSLCSSKEC